VTSVRRYVAAQMEYLAKDVDCSSNYEFEYAYAAEQQWRDIKVKKVSCGP